MQPKFLKSDNGATAIEYAMIAAFIVLAIVGVLPLVGEAVRDMFVKIASAFSN